MSVQRGQIDIGSGLGAEVTDGEKELFGEGEVSLLLLGDCGYRQFFYRIG